MSVLTHISVCVAVQIFACQNAVALEELSKAKKECINLNNKAVNLMNKNNYSSAIDLLRVVVKKDPQYSIARSNLILVLRLKAEQSLIQKEYKDALILLEEALYWAPQDKQIQERLDQSISGLKMNPDDHETRMLLARRARARLDKKGALAELRMAQKIKFEKSTKNEIEKLKRSLGLKVKKSKESQTEKPDIDFAPYMADLQRRIKRAWFPPKHFESKRIVVEFKTLSDGTVKDLKLIQSSGDSLTDEYALRAVTSASPFPVLPTGAPEEVSIQFTFDYNTFASGNLPSSTKTPVSHLKTSEKFGLKITGKEKEQLELWQTELIENPNAIETRKKIAEMFFKHNDRQVALFLLEEGINILPQYQELKFQMDKFKEHK